MIVIAKRDGEPCIRDIKLSIGRDRADEPMPIIVAQWENYAQCYTLEEFFDEFQSIRRAEDD